MDVMGRVRQVITSPPHVTVRRVGRRTRRVLDAWTQRRRDRVHPTYTRDDATPGPLVSCLAPGSLALPNAQREPMHACATAFVEQRFDLLGSGWVHVRHGMPCRGIEGHVMLSGPAVEADADGRWLEGRINDANLAESRRRWRSIGGTTTPIDWQLDFKSGHRWSARCLSKAIRYGDVLGTDVKVPWELARLQHLPTLAVTWATSGASDDRLPAAFRRQTLDFIATNPPRWGVNWCCTMDVAIRIANILVARDLLVGAGAAFDDEFERTVARSVYEHGVHVAANLEWSRELRSNHYLSNIVGLLFVAAALPSTPETDAWLALGVKELVAEVRDQFHEDGGNFEASTSYHRLSAEMVVFGTALVLGLPVARREAAAGANPFPDWYVERLAGMQRLARACSRPHGVSTQIGDNDSGRFLKLAPAYVRDEPEEHSIGWREDDGDHGHLVSALGALLGDEGESGVDAQVVRRLARGRTLRGDPDAAPSAVIFPDFGLYRLRSGPLDVVFRCGPVGQRGNGGHAHNDQLALVLSVGDAPVLVDPGTYVYTPLPARRNEFRATAMHNTVAVEGREQSDWLDGPPGLFSLRRTATARVVAVDERSIEAEHDGYGDVHRRVVRLDGGRMTVHDRLDASAGKTVMLHLHPEVEVVTSGASPTVDLRVGTTTLTVGVVDERGDLAWQTDASWHSDGYGRRRRTQTLRLPFRAGSVEWFVEAGTSA